MNNGVSKYDMSHPADAGNTAAGQTAFFTTYYNFPDYAYTDSIGLGDNRFDTTDVMKSLKSVLKNASIGYNKIYICLQYGRVSIDTRRYMELITTMFGDKVLQWSSVIFTRCNDDEMTKEKYLDENHNDRDMVELISRVKSVIFGDNMTDTKAKMEEMLRERRQDFLLRIKQDINDTSNSQYFQLPKKNLLTRTTKLVKLLFGSTPKVTAIVNEIKSFAQAVARAMQSSKYRYNFGECSICSENITDENKPIMTHCSHVYHEACLLDWFRRKPDKDCPICRTKFDQKPDIYVSLNADP